MIYDLLLVCLKIGNPNTLVLSFKLPWRGYANFQTPWNHCLDIGGEICVVLLSGSWSLCRWSAEKIDMIMKKH